MDTLKLMKALSNEINLQILSILKSGSFNPRELAKILQRDETDVSRRLRTLEKLGLVEGRWVRVRGKNVRIYSLKVGEVKISFEPGQVVVHTSKDRNYEVHLLDDKLPKLETFVGREEEIKKLTLTEKSVVIIYGIAGIGKTALAAKVFRDAFWYQMSEVDSFDYLIWQVGLFLNTLGYSPLLEYLRSGRREERDIFELTLDGLEKTGAKIVFDDVHKCLDEQISRLFSFLASRVRKAKVVLISRERPNLGISDNILYFHLKGLNLKDAYKLLKAKGTTSELSEFARIYHITKGHPLALNLFAEAYQKGRTIKADNFFDFLFNEVYHHLSSDERHILQIISLFDEPLEYEALKALYEKKNVFVVLYSLTNKGVVEKRGDTYFLHELLRGFVKKVREIGEKEYYSKYIGYLLKKQTAKDFLVAFRYTIKLGNEEKIKYLIELRLRRFKLVIQDFPDTYMKSLVQIKENPYAKKELGHIYFQKGLFKKAIELWMESKDKIDGIHRIDVISSLVDVYIELCEFDKAEGYLKELKVTAEKTDDLEVKLLYFIELTKLNAFNEKLEEALKSAFKELEIIRKMEPYPELEGLILLHIGDIYTGLGNHREAADYYIQSLEIAEVYSLTFMEHISHMELAKVYYHLGDYRTAIKHADRAVEYFLKIRNYRRAVDALAYRCVSFIGIKCLKKAERDAEEMIRIAQSTNYPLGWAGYIFLGAVQEMRGKDGTEYFKLGKERMKKYPWLYEAVLDELESVLKVSGDVQKLLSKL